MPELDAHRDPCPCHSGKVLINCCIRRGALFRRSAATRPPLPRTRHRAPSCFAASLGDCSRDITGEHYISAAILRMIGGGQAVKAFGLPWLRGEPKSLRVESLASNILCSRHNRALSSLDSAALQFFGVLQQHRAPTESAGSERRDACTLLVNGHDIERWCLKAMLGGLFSGNMYVPDAQLKGTAPPRKQLEFLFGDRAELRPWGLCVLNAQEPVVSAGPYVSVTMLSVGAKPAGIMLQLAGLQLAFVPKNIEFRHEVPRMFRPSELHIGTSVGERIIAVSWERPWGNEALHLEGRTL